jgi:hypothetical protein
MSEIDWDNKPEWADVWIEHCHEDYRDGSGWHSDRGNKWSDKDGMHWLKTDTGLTIYYPPIKNNRKEQRERLQNKPSWADAPDWAISLGQDLDGRWHWFPHYNEDDRSVCEWMMETAELSDDFELAGMGEVLGDWRDTLDRRHEPMAPPTHLNMRCIVNPIERKEWNGLKMGCRRLVRRLTVRMALC